MSLTVLRGRAGVEARGDELLRRLPDNGGASIGAEIGVFTGALSRYLLERRLDLTLYMVDSWLPSQAQPREYVDCGDWHAQRSAVEQEKYYSAAKAAVWFAGDRARVWRCSSAQAASSVQERSLDFVFIDADHSYPGCVADIALWRMKIRIGGLLCGHDYDHPTRTKFGVKRAVDEAVAHNGWKLDLGKDMTWFVRVK